MPHEEPVGRDRPPHLGLVAPVGGDRGVPVGEVRREAVRHHVHRQRPPLRPGDVLRRHGRLELRRDRPLEARPPRLGRAAQRQQHRRVRVRGGQLRPERSGRPVDGRLVPGEHRVEIRRLAAGRRSPHRDVLVALDQLGHVVAGAAEQLLERMLQRVRSRPADAGADQLERHDEIIRRGHAVSDTLRPMIETALSDLAGWCADLIENVGSIAIPYLILGSLLQWGQTLLNSVAWRNVLQASYPEKHILQKEISAGYAAGVGLNSVLPGQAGTITYLALFRASIYGSSVATIAAGAAVQAIFWSIVGGLVYLLLFFSRPDAFDVKLGTITSWIGDHLPITLVLVAAAA